MFKETLELFERLAQPSPFSCLPALPLKLRFPMLSFLRMEILELFELLAQPSPFSCPGCLHYQPLMLRLSFLLGF